MRGHIIKFPTDGCFDHLPQQTTSLQGLLPQRLSQTQD